MTHESGSKMQDWFPALEEAHGRICDFIDENQELSAYYRAEELAKALPSLQLYQGSHLERLGFTRHQLDLLAGLDLTRHGARPDEVCAFLRSRFGDKRSNDHLNGLVYEVFLARHVELVHVGDADSCDLDTLLQAIGEG